MNTILLIKKLKRFLVNPVKPVLFVILLISMIGCTIDDPGYMTLVDGTNVAVSSGNVTLVDTAGDELGVDSSTRVLTIIDNVHHEIHSGSHYYIEGHAVLGNGNTMYVKLETPDTSEWGHFVWEINSSGILTTILDEDATGGMAGGARATIHANNRNTNCWSGNHTGANNQATVLTDAAQTWVIDELVGNQVFNSSDGSSGIITTNGVNTATVAALAGGTDNDWDTNDGYEINGSSIIITKGVTACTGYIQRISDTSFGSRSSGGSQTRVDEIILKQNTVYCRSFLSGAAGNVVNFKANWYEHTDKD